MAKRKPQIKKEEVVPSNVRKVVVSQEITSDFVLEIYEKAKRARNKQRRDDLYKAAEVLSKHIGKYLVD